ncbi:uncharacterized protein MJAP1_000793 [Malassezia japonica]|uniref:ATP-dependent RNA helicase n=1 Tax=Malassezia japonica TaxID=223818 RepID=A0AAF0JEF2_9BASI|nr:uncharacterized protein MJAP1_000793 [Malassezia japonica]WFD37846.1 hypothetical protein MJAP1_000793 [Malassezia japonica]
MGSDVLARRPIKMGGVIPSLGKPSSAFEKLGLSPTLCAQLTATMPHVAEPTPAQAALIPAVLSPSDVILRAHTGSGKSLALLLALLAKPRLLFRHAGKAPAAGISAWIIVPSNELAEQYMAWARALVPTQLATSMDAVIQCVLLNEPEGRSLLGLETIRTVALDEADALLQLPGRFPSAKQVWRHQTHSTPGLQLLNQVMLRRATYSGGERLLTAGLERTGPRRGPEKRPPEHVRRAQYRGAEKAQDLAPALPREPGTVPLQLICTSATANSVLRHFLGARTGWLRTNTRETRDTACYLDQTGLTDGASASAALPREISHTCLVVDTPGDAPYADAGLQLPPIRNLARSASDAVPREMRTERAPVSPSDGPEEHVIDAALLEALAFAFAADGVQSGLALFPPRWSMRKTQAALEALGVPVQVVSPERRAAPHESPVLYLLQSSSARGLDVPGLTHVFLVGMPAVGDAVQYTHLAGRVARIGRDGRRAPGKVVTLLRGHKGQARDTISSNEEKMSSLYKRLGLVPGPFDLSLLDA